MDGATGGDNVTESMSGGALRGGWGSWSFLMKKKKVQTNHALANSTNGLRHNRTNVQVTKRVLKLIQCDTMIPQLNGGRLSPRITI